MARETSGLRILDQMEIGFDALQWWQAEFDERAAWARIALSYECGWVGDYVGSNADFGWEVYDQGSGVLAVRSTGSDGTPMFFGRARGSASTPVVGVDRAGHILEQPVDSELLDANDDGLVVPNDGVWRTLVASYRLRQREVGTLTLTGGSVTVTGVGTQFTRYSDAADPGGASSFRIATDDTVQGNEGAYEFATITDDTNATLVTPPPATESGVEFRIAGSFFDAAPTDTDIHNKVQIVWSLETRTTQRPTTGLVAADVKRSGGVLTVIPRQHANVWRPIRGGCRGTVLLPATLRDGTSGAAAHTAQVWTDQFNVVEDSVANVEALGLSAAPCAVGSHTSIGADAPTGIMAATLWDTGATTKINIRHFTPQHFLAGSGSAIAGQWDDPDAGATVDAVTEAGMLDVALLPVPAASGNTHLLFYVGSAGDVKLRASTDNGGSWGAATTILTPSGGATVSRIAAVLTRMGKIVIACAWSTGNRIRYIRSHDLGGTWETNTSAGYSSSTAGAAVDDLAIVEDDRCNLWTIAAVAGVITVYHGADEGDPVPNTAEQSSGWVATTAMGSRIDAFPGPDGTVGVVVGDPLTTSGSIYYVHLARKRVLHTQVLAEPSNEALVNTDTVVACGVGPGGTVHVLHANEAGSPGARDLGIRHLPMVAVETARSLAWFGGT